MYEIKKMSRRSKNSVGAKIGIAIILLFCVGIFIRSIIRIKNLRNNFAIINGGEINSIESPSKTGPFFRYSFYYNDKVFEGSCKTSDFKLIPREYRMHKYPIAIENDNPGNNEMLFSPQNFKTFKSDFPDSLNWLLPYVK